MMMLDETHPIISTIHFIASFYHTR